MEEAQPYFIPKQGEGSIPIVMDEHILGHDQIEAGVFRGDRIVVILKITAPIIFVKRTDLLKHFS